MKQILVVNYRRPEGRQLARLPRKTRGGLNAIGRLTTVDKDNWVLEYAIL